jgi:hypothetical protein
MALLQGIKKLLGPLLDDLPLKKPWSCRRRRKEEDEVLAARSTDTSLEKNPEDAWFGTITQSPSARAKTS